MKKITLTFSLFISLTLNALVLEDYLPNETRYDTSIPTPRAVTGLEVGQRHYRHDEIIYYLSVLAASSPRARLVNYGMTNEGRRLVLLLISSDKNMENVDGLIENPDILRIWNGFSVHGNEASGANASVLYAYHLIAGHSQKIDKMLNETLVIIDPTINPDGYNRFVTGVNSMRGIIDNSDNNDRVHQEQTPNGRTNHYWFDLNRDWLLLTQVESQARIKQFHHWQPHVLDDHHEMGSDKTFFFQPGVPERTNPLIPLKNIELTNKLGAFHAKTLSEKGMSFYTKESYDDFYPGKGSTYPDLQGSVGILFEQASAKGGVLKTSEGMRNLHEGIDNQFRTAVSTLDGAFALKQELLEYKKTFFIKASQKGKKENFRGYVLDLKNQAIKAQMLADYLSIHNIKVEMTVNDKTINNHNYEARNTFYIPIEQKQYTLIQSLFSTQKDFKDNTFYDVSSWNIGMAWGIKYDKIKQKPNTTKIEFPSVHNYYASDAIAYAFNWDDGNAPAALNFLQKNKIKVKVIGKSFSIKNNGKTIKFKPGAILIPVSKNNQEQVLSSIANMAEFFQVTSYALKTGLNETGVDLGSPSIVTLDKPKVLMLMGDGVNSYQAGSIWHLFDTSVGMALTKITKAQLKSINLHDYSHIILPSGNYENLVEKTKNKLISWIKSGGQLIALQKSAVWTQKQIQSLKKEESTKVLEEPVKSASYANYEQDLAKNTIGGAIIKANADLTHPLSYGMNNKIQHVLIKGNSFLLESKSVYSMPLIANKNALAAGYISNEKLMKSVNNSYLIVAEKLGKGAVIKFGFNPTFRGFWLGTQKWLINAVFFSNLIKSTKL